jgi:hypothetical protein
MNRPVIQTKVGCSIRHTLRCRLELGNLTFSGMGDGLQLQYPAGVFKKKRSKRKANLNCMISESIQSLRRHNFVSSFNFSFDFY